MSEDGSLLCYNSGCGQKFNPKENTSESCRHHPGHPVFHDAYKGWSCCNKKCTDFTEFLNIKGCTLSHHSNVKPVQPEKPPVDKEKANEVIEVRQPLPVPLPRPSFDSPLVRLEVEVTPSLREALEKLKLSPTTGGDPALPASLDIPIGTPCKNNACKAVYEGGTVDESSCQHHPGYPVFHEGLKFWSCCNKKTTEFDTFLSQAGCVTGSHLWQSKTKSGEVKCRLDWHQTVSHVYISVFGKKCDPDSSTIEISPVRVRLELSFPEQGGVYTKDMELAGVIDVEKSKASMNPSKVELKLAKASGSGTWSKLDLPRSSPSTAPASSDLTKHRQEAPVEGVDLDFI